MPRKSEKKSEKKEKREIDMSQYMDAFVSEAQELLESLNQCLLALEKDPQNQDFLNEMFRAAHTLKGISATMEFDQIAELTHQMESVFDRFRSGEVKIDAEKVDMLFECFDTLEILVRNAIKGEEKEVDYTPLLKKLKGIQEERIEEKKEEKREEEIRIELSEEELKALTEAKEKGLTTFEILVFLDERCALKSARALMVIKNLEKLGEIVATSPGIEVIKRKKFGSQFAVVLTTREEERRIIETVEFVPEVAGVKISPIGIEEEEVKELKVARPVTKGIQSLRVSVKRLDTLMNLVGELVINKARLSQIASSYKISELDETLTQLDRLTDDLQNEVMQARLVPVEHIFNRFPRMVRDLARELGKEIDFIIEGKEIELDRTVLDEIGEPLTHLLRNSVDHGIEPPEKREQKAKKRVGTIKLTARREKNQVIIEVADDGKGIDPQKMRDAAVKKGIMSQEEVSRLDDREAIMLISTPGFSTSSQVTELSGRGVGVDVVKTTIESLGGSMEIDSKPGLGTKFTLKLPLTMAIIQTLLVGVGNETYAIPSINVVETVEIGADKIKTIQRQEVIQLRDEIIPLLRLHHVLGAPATATATVNDGSISIVVVERGGKHVGLVVDTLIDLQEIVIKSLDDSLRRIKGLAGATILGDGRVALILDVGTLI
jgi:two-component system chemotaxis sensor kinase CheA